MTDEEFEITMNDAAITLPTIAFRALRREMVSIPLRQLERALEIIFTNSARSHQPTSNEIMAAVRGVVATETRYQEATGPLASRDQAAASNACIRALTARGTTSRQRARILCDYCESERAAGRSFSDATRQLFDETVADMLANADRADGRNAPQPTLATIGAALRLDLLALPVPKESVF